jgi:eukaryotic-like serine/threonine-protein kinase
VSEETFMSGAGGDDAQETARKAVQLGLIPETHAGDLLAKHAENSEHLSFGSFLLERGIVSLDQLQVLQPCEEDVGGATLMDAGAAGASSDPIVNEVFSGCRATSKLGQGGMGAVYRALRESDGREVVIKFLAIEQAQNRTWRGRFQREAEVCMGIAHPNMVEIYSVEMDHPRPHMVMELVDGEALDAALEHRGAFESLEGARIARDVLLALDQAHRSGVIHRDIKPANLLYSNSGEVKVLDFGLAKDISVDDGLSMPGQILGTPHYMAPEQWGDHQVDARCDVFSVGATLYHLVCGVLPFPGHSAQAIAAKMSAGEYVRPTDLNPDLPQELEFVLFRLLETDRRYRYASARAAAHDLSLVLEGQQVRVPRLIELAGPRKGQRHPLLPGAHFTIGRDKSCQVAIPDPSVSRQHAQIERGQTGFVIRDLGSSYGTYVGGMRVREVVLKEKDKLKLGKVQLEFHDGGLGQAMQVRTKKLRPDHMRVLTVEAPAMMGLAECSDRRAVVSLLEQLAPDATSTRVKDATAMITGLLGAGPAASVIRRLEARFRRMGATLPVQLFSITHENLGDDLSSWLNWWDQTRGTYPPQLGPAHMSVPRMELTVVRGEPEPRSIQLDDRPVFTMGREDTSDVVLRSRSVSRLHATLFRFHTRIVIRDEGSRFGTLLNGERVRLAFLCPGDQIVLGKVQLAFATASRELTETVESLGVDPEIYFTLEDLKHPSAARACLYFLDPPQATAWIASEGVRLYPADTERRVAFVRKVEKYYQRRQQNARAVLSAVLGGDNETSVETYRELFNAKEDDLGPQLMPAGWMV